MLLNKHDFFFSGNHTCVDKEILNNFFQVVMKDIEYSEKLLQGKTEVFSNWDFPASFCFVVTTVTTIGESSFTKIFMGKSSWPCG